MGAQKKSEACIKRALELLHSGLGFERTRVRLAAEGYSVSHGWLQNLQHGRVKHAPNAIKPESQGDPSSSNADQSGGEKDPAALLAGMIPKLETMANIAKAEGNVPAFASMTRAIISASNALAKLTPPPPPDPNLQPDFIEAAERARKLLYDQLEFLLKANEAES